MRRLAGRLYLALLAARAVWRAGWHTAAIGARMEVRLTAPVDARDAEIARLRAEVLHLRRQQQQAAALPVPAPAPRPLPPADTSPRRGEIGLRTPLERPPEAPKRPRSALDYATQPRVNFEAIVGGLKKLGFGVETAKRAAAKALETGGEPGDIMRRALKCAQEG